MTKRQVRTQPSRKRSAPKTQPQNDRSVIKVPPSFNDEQLRFRFDKVDFDDYCLHKSTPEQHKRILKRLAHLEQETLRQARSNNDVGDYRMDELKSKNKRAYEKLRHHFEELEYLCKVVVGNGGSERIFGYREGNVIHIIWFDANHSVWPEHKRCS